MDNEEFLIGKMNQISERDMEVSKSETPRSALNRRKDLAVIVGQVGRAKATSERFRIRKFKYFRHVVKFARYHKLQLRDQEDKEARCGAERRFVQRAS